MWRLTRAWPWLVVLVLASACRGTPTSSSFTWPPFFDCSLPTYGAMTATLDGTQWIPVSTRASGAGFRASDCKYLLEISTRIKGLGTYDVAAGDVAAELRCDGGPAKDCGVWRANASTDVFGKTTVTGSGSLTVTAYSPPTPGIDGSGAVEGTFSFTMAGAPGTRVMTHGRFGSRFSGFF